MMKKILTIALFFCLTYQVFAQTDGLTYQAVIINPSDLELPGVDSPGNFLPNKTIAIRFSIIDGDNEQNPPEFQEVIKTDTDDFGRVNVIIGKNNDAFRTINWDGNTKLLRVDIDFEAGNDFEFISIEELTFLPFVSHRKITASETLTVDGNTFLNGELQVENPTTLNSSLNVAGNNATTLTGILDVQGATNLFEALNVNNQSPTDLSGNLSVGGNTNLNGTLSVLGLTSLNDLQVNGTAGFGDLTARRIDIIAGPNNINGSTVIDGLGEPIRITSNMPNVDPNHATAINHPLLVEGGVNGIAIRVNGSRSNNTNFITFYDEQRSEPWGRIEGETEPEFEENADYRFDQSSLVYDIYDAGFDVAFSLYDLAASFVDISAAATSSTACVGLGGCITVPIPSWILSSTAQSVAAGLQVIAAGVGVGIAANNKTTYDNNKITLQGVTYASGSGDYAEYLQRINPDEKMTYGDIVGLNGGKISKNTTYAERMMVVSFKPIVLGNMPKPDREKEYEKVAFMGQVPVKVFGKVSIGDYIIPSGKNDGIGIAVPPNKINAKQIKSIVGVAWSESQQILGFSLVNVAVGINKNDNNAIVEQLQNKVEAQEKEINHLKNQIENILVSISEIKNSENNSLLDEETHLIDHSKYELVESPESDVVYFQITRDDFEKGLVMAEDMIRSSGEYERYKEHIEKLKNDAAFKEKFFNKLQSDLKHRLHYHKQVDRVGRN